MSDMASTNGTDKPRHTSLGGGFCYGCVSETGLAPAVVDGKQVLLCSSCDPDRTDTDA